MANIDLADAIEALRAGLMAAADKGDGQRMRFALEPVELTLEVAVTREGNAGIRWWVIEAGGGASAVATQRLTLRLAPMWETASGELTDNFAIAAALKAGDVIATPKPATAG